MMKKVIKINRINLWILIGIVWLLPQVIIFFLSEELQILKPILLIFLGLFIVFSPDIDKWFLYKTKIDKKKRKTKKR